MGRRGGDKLKINQPMKEGREAEEEEEYFVVGFYLKVLKFSKEIQKEEKKLKLLDE